MSELKMYCMGNGTTLYKNDRQIGHISIHGHVRLDDEIALSKEESESIFRVSSSSKTEFLEQWNRKDDFAKWEYMMNIPTIGQGFTLVTNIDYKNRHLPISERVKLMEPEFFEMHM